MIPDRLQGMTRKEWLAFAKDPDSRAGQLAFWKGLGYRLWSEYCYYDMACAVAERLRGEDCCTNAIVETLQDQHDPHVLAFAVLYTDREDL